MGMLAAAPGLARAADYGRIDAFLVNCMDPRIVIASHRYMQAAGLAEGRYSQFVMAGGPLAVIADSFADWRKTFWDNLGATIQLHNIHRVVALSHRDCGAVRIAFGPEAVATPELETARHALLLGQFRQAVLAAHPTLTVETGIMALDGSVQAVV
ncbi:hypothetical protein EDC65_4798 [Stella humosa]|uniref:Carbonic anhydrase n=2 Tax=Stella humosa TaxID=94 RepID=A0A3N1L177_9PROT|nr:hypothetical protein EDC65_4798 [Stella humosa]BBK29953.1 hypothetical protein STHU_05870 [Stella humosa]